MTPQKLARPPIVEALVDIQATVGEGIDADKLDEVFFERVRSGYPHKRPRHRVEITMGVAEATTLPGWLDGHQYRATDEKQVVQARLDGFSFSRLAPYDTWEAVRDEARRLWADYLVAARPTTVTRVALRYVNRIELPLPVGEMSDYLLTFPEIARSLPQMMSGMFMQLTIPDPETGATTILTEANAQQGMTPPDLVPIVLDIDTFIVRTIDIGGPEIWSALDKLAKLKNRYFFETITEKAGRLFQ